MKTGILILTVLIAGSLGLGYKFIRPHLWIRDTGAQVTCQGANCSPNEVYIAEDGRILIDLAVEQTIYIVDRRDYTVWIPNVSNFISIFGYCYYSRTIENNGVRLTEGKAYDPRLIVGAGFMEFDLVDRGRLRITTRQQ